MRPTPLLLLALTACGLKPLYSAGDASARPVLADVMVAEVPGGAPGWVMTQALRDRMAGGSTARYRLTATIDDRIEGFGVRRDAAVTRERRTLRIRYQLIDSHAGTTLLDATAGHDAGIDVVSSDYATVAAEDTALDNLARLVADKVAVRVTSYLRTQKRP